MIQGAFTSGRFRSRSHIASLLKRSVPSASRRADIASMSAALGDARDASPPSLGGTRIGASSASVPARNLRSSRSSRAKFSVEMERAFLGTPGGRVLLTSMYTPALLWMYPYSHRTRANGDEANASSASSTEADGDTRASTARASASRASAAATSAATTAVSSASSSGSSSRDGGRATGSSGTALATRRPLFAPRKVPQTRGRWCLGTAPARPVRRALGARARAATGVERRAKGDIARAFAKANGGWPRRTAKRRCCR